MKTGLGEWWDNFAQESEELTQKIEKRRKEAEEKYNQYLKEQEEEKLKRLEELQKHYNFMVTEELVPALERLEGLAVNKYRMDDYSCQDCFKEVWNSVQHEVDLYEEGEESPLNKNSCRGAKNWLNSFKHLC